MQLADQKQSDVDKYGPKKIQTERIFKTIIEVSPFADGKYWYLRKDVIWISNQSIYVCAPAGFVTDFASIPRPIWSLLPKWDGYGGPAIVHDFIYWNQHVSQKTADQWLWDGMVDMNVASWKRPLIYAAVRLFGWITWWLNARKKASGRIRIIPSDKLPTDPLETWEQCELRIKENTPYK